MNGKDILNKLESKKELMMQQTGPQCSILRPEFTREEYQKIYNNIQVVKNAINNFYYPQHHINRITIADYWINQIDLGFNNFSFSGRTKDIKLSNGTEEIVIRDTIAKQFILLYLEYQKE